MKRAPDDVRLGRHFQVARLRAGDVLVFRTEEHLPQAARDRIESILKGLVPEGVRVAVLDGGARLSVLRTGDK